MAEVEAIVHVPADRVWAVLSDGWLYSGWVVGATHIREVDSGWPGVGSKIHHSVGSWPLTIEDTTEVTEVEPGRVLQLLARAWPAGDAVVRVELTALGPDRTRVVMKEQARSGPGKLVPQPLRDLLLVRRNRESLARLTALATGREG
ncbi:SRPBCC family protein [Actinokineospora bangkokensis]|uniref:Polyketide cyclase n=1 Tax=Actinokineospora bangkokensis TaxID=1193682 RepID=A0A1Q9LMQ1_9PSEU|nr:SRPBCC family protein [Actinokineospora bangkokensis]OLR93308.1 polyketide cyclase [Actinokineospora bangkokensis]